MKGPMTTQTLRGLNDMEPFHWRGDRTNFANFNLTFTELLGGPPLSSNDLAAYTAFINTVLFEPNPNQNLDRTLSTNVSGGSALLGFENFKVIKMDVFRFIDQSIEQFDFIFAGPPYALTEIDELPMVIFEKKLLKQKGWFVLEHTPRNDYKKFPFYKTERNYGTTIFSIFIENR